MDIDTGGCPAVPGSPVAAGPHQHGPHVMRHNPSGLAVGARPGLGAVLVAAPPTAPPRPLYRPLSVNRAPQVSENRPAPRWGQSAASAASRSGSPAAGLSRHQPNQRQPERRKAASDQAPIGSPKARMVAIVLHGENPCRAPPSRVATKTIPYRVCYIG